MKHYSAFLSLLAFLFLAPINAESADAPWDPDEVTLVREKLAEGVYAVLAEHSRETDHTGTTAGFVVGTGGVLLIETMLNEDLYGQLETLVREVTDKPIRWAVNTSFHGDHSYGNYLLPADAVIIQHPHSKRFVEETFAADLEFMTGVMGEGKGLEKVQPRSANLALTGPALVDLGGQQVEIHNFGFGQTAGDLVVWVPDARVMWTGNLVQGPAPSLPWLLHGRHRETIETLEKVLEFLPDDARIVPGHGRIMQPFEVDHSIDYLKRLDREVDRAVEAGLDLDETREAAAMADYAAYSLYGWIHFEVNIPAIYNELSGRASGRH